MPNTTFSQLNIPSFLVNKLEEMGYKNPTEIQKKAIPLLINGKDILASSQTGSGKTAAFAIPIITNIVENPETSALILAPTRELALQIKEVFHQMRGQQKIFTATLFGGASIEKQMIELKRKPNVVIATPGRLKDHMKRRTINLSKFQKLVLDEFDRMLDMGFRDEIADIIKQLPQERQTMMFSATQRDSVIKLAKTYLNNYEQITIAQKKETHENIEQFFIQVENSEKYNSLLKEVTERAGSIIIFTNMKRTVDDICELLQLDNIKAQAIHGDLRQSKRESTIKRFKEGKFRVLVATDVVARGIDIDGIECVINYDTPRTFEDYTHRIGRTGRAGAKGISICFVTRSEKTFHQNILKKINSDEAEPVYNKKSKSRTVHGGRPSFSRNDRNFSQRRNSDRSEGSRYQRRDGEQNRGEGRSEGSRYQRRDGEQNRGEGRSENSRYQRRDDERSEGSRYQRRDGEQNRGEGRSEGSRHQRRDGERNTYQKKSDSFRSEKPKKKRFFSK